MRAGPTVLDLLAPGEGAKLQTSWESGVPVRYLRTVGEKYPEMAGEPFASIVILAADPVPESVRRVWYRWMWRANIERR